MTFSRHGNFELALSGRFLSPCHTPPLPWWTSGHIDIFTLGSFISDGVITKPQNSTFWSRQLLHANISSPGLDHRTTNLHKILNLKKLT